MLLPLATAFASFTTASAHIGYGGRDFGSFSGSENRAVFIDTQTIAGAHGWADATDADWGDSHKGRFFRFKLLTPATITIKAEAFVNTNGVAGLKPAFSVYAGLAHLSPAQPDHDGAPITVAYLDSIPGVQEGALKTLENWQIGNEDSVVPYDFETMMSKFVYVGHAADGTSANFGSAAGIQGDGTQDGVVQKAFDLPAGDYSIFVGGADYATVDTATYGTKVTLSVGPDPGSGVTPVTPGMEGVPYKWEVELEAEDEEELITHVGAWSWEDNSLFQPGQPSVGWTHTSAWAAIELKALSHLNIQMARQEGVPWPAADNANRVAGTASMYPSFTIWKNWDKDGDQLHTYDNRGNPAWAEKLEFIGYVDNSTQTSSSRGFNLPAGEYTIVFGSNSPATTSERQGFKATLTTSSPVQPVALKGDAVPELTGVTFKAMASPTMNDSDKVAFVATLEGADVTKLNDTAIIADVGATQLKLVAREGDEDPVSGSVFTFFGDPVTDNHDNVLFFAKLKASRTEGVGGANDSGLWRYDVARQKLEIMAREGEAAGTEDGATFKSFSSVVLDTGGGAFVAKLNIRGRVNAGNDTGVWLFTESGFKILLAREGKPFTVATDDVRIVKTLTILEPAPIVKGAGRSTNALGGRVLSLTFKDGTSGIFHIAP